MAGLPLNPFAASPVGPVARETRIVVFATRSRTNTLLKRSSSSLDSPSASLTNAT
jgi:hypothetical protein